MEEKFTVFMLKDFNLNGKTTMVAPAEGFYASKGIGRNEIRIAYVLNERDLEDAMNVLEAGLRSYNNR